MLLEVFNARDGDVNSGQRASAIAGGVKDSVGTPPTLAVRLGLFGVAIIVPEMESSPVVDARLSVTHMQEIV